MLDCSVVHLPYSSMNHWNMLNMISNSISNWFENVSMRIFTFPNRLWVLYNWMNSKSLLSFEPRGIKCHKVQFCPAKRNFWSYYYMVASTLALVYRLCSPFLPKIDKFSNITHQYIPVLSILLNSPKIQLSTLFLSLFQFWNSIRSWWVAKLNRYPYEN